MAQGMKELRRRIRGITSIQKITRAMEMVATTRLRRAQTRAEGARPFADAIKNLSALLAGRGAKLSSPLMEARPQVKRIAVVVIGSDRGLCGSYNANVFRRLSAFLGERQGLPFDLHVLGSKPRQHYARRLPIKVAYPDEVEDLTYRRAREIARDLTAAFLKGEVDEVWIVFTRFISAGKQVPTVERLLPITADAPAAKSTGASADERKAATRAAAASSLILLEPSPQQLFELLVPKSLAMRLYAAFVDAMASEQAQRRMAMKAATDAAGDMISSLSRKYNRARQETITKELLDIVGGAEALK
jgi:F-type H+-transporting ATPase subunit gamma